MKLSELTQHLERIEALLNRLVVIFDGVKIRHDNLDVPIEHLPLPTPFYKVIQWNPEFQHVKTLRDLSRLTEWDLIREPNLGSKSVEQIRKVLAMAGLHLEAGYPHWHHNKEQDR